MFKKIYKVHFCALALLVLTLLCLNPNQSRAEDQHIPDAIVVSATKNERPIDSVASSLKVIDSYELERKQAKSVSEILDKQPELDVVSTGSKGSSTSVSIRGANPEHTLVVLDGIELNNPILPNRTFNFADLQLNEVQQIEILRGPQSTLYGSDAMGGVINITSKQSSKDFEYSALSEAGSYSTFLEQAGVAGKKDDLSYGLSFLREDTHGISAADSRLGNTEADSYGNSSYFARLGFSPEDAFKLNTIFRAVDSESDLDNFGGAFGDDPNRVQSNEQYFWGTSLSSDFLDQKLKTLLSYSLTDQSFNDDNDPDVLSADYLRSKYQGFYQAIKVKADYQATEYLNLMLGADSKVEEGESRYLSDGAFGPFENNFDRRSSTTNGIFTQTILDFSELASVAAGIRVDDQSAFGSRTTWKVAPQLNFTESGLRLFSTVGTGYKAPSLFQLYSSYGSPDLNAEKSLGVDAGFEQKLFKDKAQFRMAYFHQDFDNLIDFDPATFIYSNINSATTQGLENELQLILSESLKIGLGYTYLDATNEDSGAALLRKARHKFAADINYQPNDRLDLTLQSNYRSSSYDNDYSSLDVQRAELSGYNTVDFLAGYQLTEDLRIFGRVENLLDQNYQEVLGYGTYGITAFGGIEIKG